MKRKLTLILTVLLAFSLILAGCGAGMAPKDAVGNTADSTTTAPGGSWNDSGAAGDYDYPDDNWYGVVTESPAEPETDGGLGGTADNMSDAVKPQTDLAEKIIYSADVEIETVNFDGALESIESMLDYYGAFLESSSVTGTSYRQEFYGNSALRSAYYVIRVPVDSFEKMRQSMGDVGRVLSSRVYTDNITTVYYDTQSRADSYRIEQERLVAMLEKCETVSDMIEIESRLSEVRYQLESLESTLRNWQNQVDYSTINVSISEVEELTRVTEPHRTYWQQIGDGLKETLSDMGGFFKGLFKGIVISLPVILLIALVAVVIIVAAVRVLRKRRARYAQKSAEINTRTDDDKI